MKTSVDQEDLWERASRNYALVGPPFKPSAEDVARCWEIVQGWIQRRGTPRVLLLGVTPQLYNLPWPDGTDFVAVDRSQTMIDAVWPGPKESAKCADWLFMDLPEASRDIVLCDGGLQVLEYPEGQRRLGRLLHRILSADGLCIFRVFALPHQQETPEAVMRELLDGRISTIDALKLRLIMAMQHSAKEGIELGQVYEKLIQVAPDLDELAARVGWPVDQMLFINDYKDLSSSFYVPTLEQTVDLFCAEGSGFQVHALRTPSGDSGALCPTLALRRARTLGGAA